MIQSQNKITRPAHTVTTAGDGLLKDLISFKCSFLSYLTFSRVSSNIFWASEHCFSASSANALARFDY